MAHSLAMTEGLRSGYEIRRHSVSGSNCDHDCYHAVKHVFGQEAEYIWHKTSEIKKFDCLILPGGFSYGDYPPHRRHREVFAGHG